MRLCLAFMCVLMVLPAFGQERPGADELLKTARFVATLQQQDLTGSIRKEGGTKFPVGLYLRGEDIQFSYNQPGTGKAVRFHMRLSDDHYDLFEIVNNETRRFPEGKLAQPIETTDLSYEDLAMRFLYWPNGIVDGEEKVKGESCWRVRLVNPTGKGLYAQVRVWVHKKSQALMQVVGYDRLGKPLKRFLVTDVMKVGDTWTLERMRVDRFDPVTGKTLGLTYLDFDKPKGAAPKGLR